MPPYHHLCGNKVTISNYHPKKCYVDGIGFTTLYIYIPIISPIDFVDVPATVPLVYHPLWLELGHRTKNLRGC